jgi:hypothetical protein
MIPNSPRIGGGITGKAQANVSKVYQQMEQQKKKAAAQPMKPAQPKQPAERMKPPTTPGGVAPKKNRSAFEDNRMQ